MIRDNINTIGELNLYNDEIQYCFDFFRTHNLSDYAVGNYETERKNINFRIDEYKTQIASERYWQAHKYHMDIYILLKGQERIDMKGKLSSETMNAYHYDKKEDMLMLEEVQPDSINYLNDYGDILIFFAGEAHKTGIHAELENEFKVVLFKIKLSENKQ